MAVYMTEKAYMAEHKRMVQLMERTATDLQKEADRQKKEVKEAKTVPKSVVNEVHAAMKQRPRAGSGDSLSKYALGSLNLADEDDDGPSLGEQLGETVAEPLEKVVQKKAKKAEKQKREDIYHFRPWTYDGTDYYKNKRGDVITTEYEWVGHWNGRVLNEKASEPSDLAEGAEIVS